MRCDCDTILDTPGVIGGFYVQLGGPGVPLGTGSSS